MIYQGGDIPSVGLNIKDPNQKTGKTVERMNKYFFHMHKYQQENRAMVVQEMQKHITNVLSECKPDKEGLKASQYEVRRARFKGGQLELLLHMESEQVDEKNTLWMNIEENISLRPVIDSMLACDIKVTGKPSKR